MFRSGRVTSVNEKKHTVRVKFTDGDGYESFDLPVLVTLSGDYSLPPSDALVLCALEDGPEGIGYVLGVLYSEADAPPLDAKTKRSVVGNDLRLGTAAADKKIALADKAKDEAQKVLDYAQGIATAIQAGVVVAQDGGASLKATIVAALPTPPTLSAPAAEHVSAS